MPFGHQLDFNRDRAAGHLCSTSREGLFAWQTAGCEMEQLRFAPLRTSNRGGLFVFLLFFTDTHYKWLFLLVSVSSFTVGLVPTNRPVSISTLQHLFL